MTNNWWLNDERRASIVCLSMDERENMAKTVCFFLADERFISFLFPTFNYTFRCVHAQFSNTIILSDPKALVLHNVLFTQHTQKKCATEQAIHELESERFIFFRKYPLLGYFNIKLPRSQKGHPENSKTFTPERKREE